MVSKSLLDLTLSLHTHQTTSEALRLSQSLNIQSLKILPCLCTSTNSTHHFCFSTSSLQVNNTKIL
ncbi:unnamed protein product [Brassica rapa subsp. trilocularis]